MLHVDFLLVYAYQYEDAFSTTNNIMKKKRIASLTASTNDGLILHKIMDFF